MYYFLCVNYDSTDFVEKWANSINKLNLDCEKVVVDCYHSTDEREKIKKLAESMCFDLLYVDNIGYGRGLNLGLSYLSAKIKETQFSIMFGNSDIEFTSIGNIGDETVCIAPEIFEGSRNRNPFLTRFQGRFLWLYDLAYYLRSRIIKRLASVVMKGLSIVPSKTYAVHGSLFVVENHIPILPFNENTFLYCEEMEFAEYLMHQGIRIVKSENYSGKHFGGVSTSKAFVGTKHKFSNWRVSWKNYRDRQC